VLKAAPNTQHLMDGIHHQAHTRSSSSSQGAVLGELMAAEAKEALVGKALKRATFSQP
jgi:hypothetical protein